LLCSDVMGTFWLFLSLALILPSLSSRLRHQKSQIFVSLFFFFFSGIRTPHLLFPFFLIVFCMFTSVVCFSFSICQSRFSLPNINFFFLDSLAFSVYLSPVPATNQSFSFPLRPSVTLFPTELFFPPFSTLPFFKSLQHVLSSFVLLLVSRRQSFRANKSSSLANFSFSPNAAVQSSYWLHPEEHLSLLTNSFLKTGDCS